MSSSDDTGTLGKAIHLLDLIASAQDALRFSDLLKLTGQPKGSLHRQLRHLVVEGLVDISPDGAYQPGIRLLKFASRAWARNTVRKLAEPHMKVLHEITGETVHFGMLRGAEIVYLDKLESRQAVRMHSQVGNASPVYCTGIGKAAISCLPEDRLADLVHQVRFHRYTASTIADAAALQDALGPIRQRGYAEDLEEHQAGICCVAASIVVASQNFIGGISVTAPVFRAGPSEREKWVAPVRQAASSIAEDMTHGLSPAHQDR
ncbi:IclR family transcriptional regulator [Rhizobium rhizoryzae]|jgi:DNA-binding IclR family transcriptional regulator|uniref:IclR family transcriptional regulator n=1 Tax=Rhizobium rhizoryzae TaxID=451876 RepID=UPI002897044E|nr:IclR family transcriptional regulator [Rhizobium rhizoryzae]